MKKFIKIITLPITYFCIGLIYLYKILISPLIPKSCIYTPSCSTYGVIAFKRFGCIKGFFLTVKRVLRCNAHHKGGLDPVPDNIKGEIKWIL